MPTPPSKRQKRGDDKPVLQSQDGGSGSGGEIKMPQKRFYRQRAHANPFSDHMLSYPLSPAHMDWTSYFPAFVDPDSSKVNLSGARKLLKDVEVVDIGCGFGGLLVGLAPALPDTLMLGMEIRHQVLEYVQKRVVALRSQQQQQQQQQKTPSTPDNQPSNPPSTQSRESPIPGGYQNISALRSNTMKFFPNFFAKHQLSKIFICFPDPHFKARKHKARIISETLNAEYAYVLRPGGLLYTITDVEEYHYWILDHFRQDCGLGVEDGNGSSAGDGQGEEGGIKDLWERVSDEDVRQDTCVQIMKDSTEEGQKVSRNKGNKFVAVFRRKDDPQWPA